MVGVYIGSEEPMEECMRDCDGGILLDLEVTPNSSQSSITGVDEWRKRLKVKVTAKPDRGAANQEILFMFRDLLGVKSGDVTIIAGHTSSQKTLEVRGTTTRDALDLIRMAMKHED